MKKYQWATVAGTALLTFATTITALAGSWKLDNVGWWWQKDDGSYPVSSWEWIDGNNDGIAECYYFNEVGYMLANTTTPDGYQVNVDGAWISNGVIQTKKTIEYEQVNAVVASTSTKKQIRHLDIDLETNETIKLLKNTPMPWVYAYNCAQEFKAFKKRLGENTYSTTYEWLSAYADYCDDGAFWATLIDRYEFPYDFRDDMDTDDNHFIHTSPSGMSSTDGMLYKTVFDYMFYIIENVGTDIWSPKYDETNSTYTFEGRLYFH